MCLAVPGQIVSIDDGGDLRTARVAFGGVMKVVCVACVPEAAAGDYVLVHAGFAIATIDEAHAREIFDALADHAPAELAELAETSD